MKPRVYLVARPQFDDAMFLEFLRQAGTKWNRSGGVTDAEEIVEAAGRVCYMSFGERQSPRTNDQYVRNLVRMGHESVLEHVAWTFIVERVSRAFTHQLVRHRVGFAFSQLSQQYHDESAAEFIEPPHLDEFPEAQAAWRKSIEAARDAYRVIRDEITKRERRFGPEVRSQENLRVVRSMARSVLPNATETKIVITGNARALRHFLRVRGSIPGDTEMRLVAAELLSLLSKEAPALFADFRTEQFEDGLPIVVHSVTTENEP